MASYRNASSGATAAPSGATDSGCTCHTVSAATRSGSRLVVISRSPGELASRRWQTRAQASIRCSQLSSDQEQPPGPERIGERVDQRAPGLLADADRRRDT